MAKVVTVKRIANPAKQRQTAAKKSASNPALLVTLGATNPTKRRHKTMKVVKAKSHARNPKGRASSPAKRSNPTRVIVTAPRPRKRNGIRSAANPQIFGQAMKPVQLGKAVVGSLIGVAATKLIPAALPSQIITSQPLAVLASGVVAFGSGMLAKKADPAFGDGVLFGGLMQVVSLALNTYLPLVGNYVALRGGRGVNGLGYIAPGSFTFPENPIRNALTAPAPAPVVSSPAAMSGLSRAFPRAF